MSGLNLQPLHETDAGFDVLVEAKRGNVQAVSRLISLVENRGPEGAEVLQSINGIEGAAIVIGVTGYPGAGKSTLVNQLVRIYRGQGKKVGIIAIDPSSPKTGGALLGDRIRMQEHANDPGVFIRSMATRGHQGGLTPNTNEVVKVLRAAGYQIILIETVGVGQGDVEVAQAADIVVAVVTPGLGDEVQALKAGLLELADVVVVNKKDQNGADATLKHLKEWVPRVLPTKAITGEGVDGVVTAIAELVSKPSEDANTVRHR